MAKIRDSKPKSTVISNGTELERIIVSLSQEIQDLDKFLSDCSKGVVNDGTYLCTKKILKKSSYSLKHHEPDFIAFSLKKVGKDKVCYVVELKDGDAFDTKKAPAEKEMLNVFVNHLARQIPFITKYYICCFNQDNKDLIVSGFKKAFELDEVMTGREFCEILGIDYDNIVAKRKSDEPDNYKYVIEQMSPLVQQEQRKHIIADEFYSEDNTDSDD